MTAQIAELKVGDPFDDETDIGSMVSEAETARVCEWLDEAVAAGASIDRWNAQPAQRCRRRS